MDRLKKTTQYRHQHSSKLIKTRNKVELDATLAYGPKLCFMILMLAYYIQIWQATDKYGKQLYCRNLGQHKSKVLLSLKKHTTTKKLYHYHYIQLLE